MTQVVEPANTPANIPMFDSSFIMPPDEPVTGRIPLQELNAVLINNQGVVLQSGEYLDILTSATHVTRFELIVQFDLGRHSQEWTGYTMHLLFSQEHVFVVFPRDLFEHAHGGRVTRVVNPDFGNTLARLIQRSVPPGR